MLFLRVAYRSDNFIVGLMNVSPKVSRPRLWNYTLCGQYPGAVPAGATVSLNCPYNLPPFRYVIVQFPSLHSFNFCELEVHVAGARTLWIFIVPPHSVMNETRDVDIAILSVHLSVTLRCCIRMTNISSQLFQPGQRHQGPHKSAIKWPHCTSNLTNQKV